MNWIVSSLKSYLWCVGWNWSATWLFNGLLCNMRQLNFFVLIRGLIICIFHCLCVFRQKSLWRCISVKRDSGAVWAESDIPIPHYLVDWCIQRINVEPLSSVHHLANVKTVKPQQRSLFNHFSPVAKLREELLICLINPYILPDSHAVWFKELPWELLWVDNFIPFLVHSRACH